MRISKVISFILGRARDRFSSNSRIDREVRRERDHHQRRAGTVQQWLRGDVLKVSACADQQEEQPQALGAIAEKEVESAVEKPALHTDELGSGMKKRKADACCCAESRKRTKVCALLAQQVVVFQKARAENVRLKEQVGDFQKLQAENGSLKENLQAENADLKEELARAVVLFQQNERELRSTQLRLQRETLENESLKNSLEDISARKGELLRQIQMLEKNNAEQTSHISGSYSDFFATPPLLQSALETVIGALSGFTKVLLSAIKESSFKEFEVLHAWLPGFDAGILAKRVHVKYAFQAAISLCMFNAFENDDYGINGGCAWILDLKERRNASWAMFQESRPLDARGLLANCASHRFGRFCRGKFLQLIGFKMVKALLGDTTYTSQIQQGYHPNIPIYDSFLELAKSVWLLHLLAFSFEPSASIYRVAHDAKYDPEFMEEIVVQDEEVSFLPEVAFMVLPGFSLRNTVVKSKIYLKLNTRECSPGWVQLAYNVTSG